MSVRTTVTLDDDVVERLKAESRALGVPFRQAINDFLRLGMLAAEKPSRARTFRVEPRHMGMHPGIDYNNISALLELGEGDRHR